MIEAVAKIGKIQRQRRGVTSHLDELIQNIYNPNAKKPQYLLKIVIKEDHTADGTTALRFSGVEKEELKPDTCKKILYRSFKGVGVNPSPSAAITDKDSFGIKVLRLLERSARETDDPQESLYFTSVYNALLDSQDEIRNSIEIYKDSKEQDFLTVTFIDESGEEKYLIDEQPFVNLFLRNVDGKESRYGNIGTCSICGKENVEVFGGVSAYKFFNLDKEGFLAGFSKEESYKNFPICADCIRDLNEGKDYIVKNLTFTFVRGLNYQLIPQPLQDDESLQDVLSIIETQKQSTSNLVNGETLQRITESENDITFFLKDTRDTISLNFLFLKVSNSAEKILALIQDVLPSRLSELYAAKNNVESLFQKLTNRDFTFGTIRQFFPREDPAVKGTFSNNKVGLDKYFLDITDRIFKGRMVDNDFLFQFTANRIRTEFVKLLKNEQNNFRFITIDALRMISFLNYLKLLKIKEAKMDKRRFDDFFEHFGNVFKDPLKRGLFLLGAATQMLLDVQNNVRGTAPFLKQLKSLRMNEKDFRELFVKVQDKVQEYGNVVSNARDQHKLTDARTFLSEASYYFIQIDKFGLSVPEMNFYFACGMNLAQDLVNQLVSSLVSQKNEEGENELN